MYGEIITIGDELTSGRTLNLNARYAAGRLTAAGLRVNRITSVGDNYPMVAEALKRAIKNSRFVIVTGGLGSTEDDRTSEIVAKALNRPLRLNGKMFRLIEKHVEEMGAMLTPSLEKMAWMPQGSRLLSPEGRACGFCLVEKGVRLYFLPGVPEQMRYLLDKVVIPELLSFWQIEAVRSRILKVYGLSEPDLAEMFKNIEERTGEVVLGFYPHFPEIHITLSLRGGDEVSVSNELDRVEAEIFDLIGSYIFAKDDETLEEVVGGLLRANGLTISVAESCTGGLVGHRITNVSGSSDYFQGGIICYSNSAKVNLLGVSEQILKEHGAVSSPIAKQMAEGVRKALGSDLGVSITGIAGPTGGSESKPVGTVFIGLCRGEEVIARRYRFWGRREQIKLQSATMALDWIRRYVTDTPLLPGI